MSCTQKHHESRKPIPPWARGNENVKEARLITHFPFCFGLLSEVVGYSLVPGSARMPDLEAYIAMLAVFASAHTYMPGCCLLLEAYIAMLAALVCLVFLKRYSTLRRAFSEGTSSTGPQQSYLGKRYTLFAQAEACNLRKTLF